MIESMVWKWIAIALGILLALALLVAGVERTRRADIESQFASYRANAAELARLAEAKEREAERQWGQKVLEVSTNAQTKINALAADLAASRTARSRLLAEAADAARRGASQAPPAAGSGPGVPGVDPLDLLIGMLSRHSGELVEIGEYADKLRIAGEACERIDAEMSR